MNPQNNIERLIEALVLPGTEAGDERILNDALEAFKRTRQSETNGVRRTSRRIIMKSRVTKLAAAAVIVIAVLVGVQLFIGPDERPPGPGTVALEAETKQINAMAAAGDIDGLVTMLPKGQFASKVLAAEYLGGIGDERALPELERLYLAAEEQLPEGYTKNPFAEPIEKIKGRMEPEPSEPLTVPDANETTVVDVTKRAPAETNEPAETSEVEVAAVNAPAETPTVLDFNVVSDKAGEDVIVPDTNETAVVDVAEGLPAEANEPAETNAPAETNETEVAAVNEPAETPTTMDFYVVHKKTKEPLAGVRINIKIQREGPDDVNELMTDEQGLCKINFGDLRTNYILIKVHKDHFVPADIRVSKAEDKAHIFVPRSYTLALEPGTSIGGFVRNVRRGPIAGATVYLRSSGGSTSPRFWIWDYEEKTDANGFWRCDIMPADIRDIGIRLAHPDYIDDESYDARPTPALQQLRDMNSVMVMNIGVNFAGTVVDCNGRPIAKASVRQGQENTWSIIYPRTETDDEGRFEFRNTRAGRVMLTVQAKGYAPQVREVSVRYGMEPVEFRLDPAQTIRGRVVDAADKPMEGVEVSLESWHSRDTIKWETKTDAEGVFEWNQAPKDEMLFSFSKKGYRPVQYLKLTPDVDEHIIVMDSALKVSGKVVDADSNEPINEFRLILGSRSWEDGPMDWDRTTAQSFTRGRYEMDLTWVRSFRGSYMIMVEANGYLPGISRTLTEEEENVVIDFRLEKGQGPTGTIYLPSGELAAGARVALSTPSYGVFYDKRWQSVIAGADGRFSFWPQVGRYLVVVIHNGGYAEVTDEELAAEPNIMLEPWGRLEGVLRVGGRVLARESVRVECLKDYDQNVPPPTRVNFNYGWRFTDANGCFTVERMLPGKVKVFHLFPITGRMSARTRCEIVEVLPGETANVTIGGGGRTVTGRFTAIGYEPIWHRGQVSLDVKLPEPPRPNDYDEMIYLERRRWTKDWRNKTEEGRLHKIMERQARGCSYRANIEPGGTFRVDDVPPGEYELRACFGSNIGGKVMWGLERPVPPPDYEFVVPDMNEKDANEPLNLGVIRIRHKEYLGAGDPAPLFAAVTFDGKGISLLDFRGKVVLLTFWASEPRVLSHLDYILELAGSYKANERFVALGMSLDRDVETAKKFAKDNELKWINCFPAPARRVEVSDDYEIWKFPMTFVIDPYGYILTIDPSPLRFKSKVEKALSR